MKYKGGTMVSWCFTAGGTGALYKLPITTTKDIRQEIKALGLKSFPKG